MPLWVISEECYGAASEGSVRVNHLQRKPQALFAASIRRLSSQLAACYQLIVGATWFELHQAPQSTRLTWKDIKMFALCSGPLNPLESSSDPDATFPLTDISKVELSSPALHINVTALLPYSLLQRGNLILVRESVARRNFFYMADWVYVDLYDTQCYRAAHLMLFDFSSNY